MQPKDVAGWPDPEFVGEMNPPGPVRDSAVVLARVVAAAERWVDDGNSHSALARRAKVPRTTWNSIRKGTSWPRLDRFVPLARAVGVELVSLSDSSASRTPEGYGSARGTSCDKCFDYLKYEYYIDSWAEAGDGDVLEVVEHHHGYDWDYDVNCGGVRTLKKRGIRGGGDVAGYR